MTHIREEAEEEEEEEEEWHKQLQPEINTDQKNIQIWQKAVHVADTVLRQDIVRCKQWMAHTNDLFIHITSVRYF